jgi:hypothetical protein
MVAVPKKEMAKVPMVSIGPIKMPGSRPAGQLFFDDFRFGNG